MADTVTIATTENKVTVQTTGQDLVTLTSPAADQVTVALGVGPVSLAGQTTDSLGEGSTNLYFSNARASAAAPVQSVVASTGMNILTNAQGDVSVTNTKLGTVTGVTMPSGYAVADVSGALTVSYNNLAAVRTGLGLVPGTAADQIVQLDSSAKLPAVDGSALTNLPSAPTFGIANTNAAKIDSTSVADDEYARFTANGLESRSTSEVLSDIGAAASSHAHNASTDITSGTLSVARGGTGLSSISTLLNSNTTKSDVGLGNVENTAISTFAGSSNITTVGTISSGTWSGTAIAYADVSGTPTLGTAAAADTGTGSTNVILGNDSRLTDARTPVAHSATLITSGTLAVDRGGTGSATAPMVGVVTAADAAAARTVLGLGTVATTASTAYATAAQGGKADSAMQDLVDDTAPELGGHFDVKAQKVFTSTTNGTIAIVPKGSGGLEVGGNHDSAANVGKISWMCEAGTHGVSIKGPPHSAAATYELVLPTATGTVGQALKTDGSGNLGWSSFVAASAVSTFGGTLIDDASAGDARTTLGATTVGSNVFTAADQAAARSAIGVGTGTGDMVGSNNLSDVTTPGTALTNLGGTTVGVNVFTAADAAAARSAIGAGSGTGDLVASNNLSDLASASTARTNLGITNTGSYTGHIETAADKTYVLDPAAATDRTISAFYIKVNSGSGTVSATLKVGTSTVKTVTASTSTGAQTGLHPGASAVTAGDAITLVFASNSSATDVIFSVEYTE